MATCCVPCHVVECVINEAMTRSGMQCCLLQGTYLTARLSGCVSKERDEPDGK